MVSGRGAVLILLVRPCLFLGCCSSKREFYPAASAGEPGGFVLKWAGMNPEPRGITASLARAWRAVARAFAPAADARPSQQYGADTTLFGTSTEVRRDGAKSEFWIPSETTDFADMDGERDPKDRR